MWIQLFLFLMFSSALLWLTLRRPHAYRGYRFIAFECVLALIFLQAEVWFADPFRFAQILSWIALLGSLLLALHGFWLLRKYGAPDQDLENTTALVTMGAYRYIRHPLYASLLLFSLGATLKSITPLSLAILFGNLLAIYATDRVEEKTNLVRFGEAYREYMQHTHMFMPFLL